MHTCVSRWCFFGNIDWCRPWQLGCDCPVKWDIVQLMLCRTVTLCCETNTKHEVETEGYRTPCKVQQDVDRRLVTDSTTGRTCENVFLSSCRSRWLKLTTSVQLQLLQLHFPLLKSQRKFAFSSIPNNLIFIFVGKNPSSVQEVENSSIICRCG